MAQVETVDVRNLQIVYKTSTSKGTQIKWYDDNTWYKADRFGYEGLAETVVSRLLKNTQVDCIVYKPVYLSNGINVIAGCASKNFKHKDEVLFSAEHLHRTYTGIGLAKYLVTIPDVHARIKYTVDFLERITNLKQVGAYITRILEIDALFLNEDRHTNNLAVLYNTKAKQYRLTPIFDNGLALLADTHVYNVNADIYKEMSKVQAKPFETDFYTQVACAEDLYGIQIKYKFTKKQVQDIVLCEELQTVYGSALCQRVQDVIFAQMRKYNYLF